MLTPGGSTGARKYPTDSDVGTSKGGPRIAITEVRYPMRHRYHVALVAAAVDTDGCLFFTFAGNPKSAATNTTEPILNYVTKQQAACFTARR